MSRLISLPLHRTIVVGLAMISIASWSALMTNPATAASSGEGVSDGSVFLSQSLPPMEDQGQYPPQQYQGQDQGQYQGQYQQQQQYQSPSTLQGYVATAPVGTVMSAMLASPISSQFVHPGDHFTATLGSDMAAGGGVILPAGTQLDGQVASVQKAGMTGKNGSLDVRFVGATLPNGQHVPLSARIKTDDNSGVIKGGTTLGRVGGTAVRTGVGAGLGAALGTAMGPLSGGHVGRGAIYGTALGGGLGLASELFAKGKDAIIPSDKPVNIVLDQPLTVGPQSGYGQSQQYQYNQYQQPNNYNNYGGGYHRHNNSNNGGGGSYDGGGYSGSYGQ